MQSYCRIDDVFNLQAAAVRIKMQAHNMIFGAQLD